MRFSIAVNMTRRRPDVPMERVVQRTAATMQRGCTLDSRRKQPKTSQLVDNPKLNSS